MGQDRPVTLTEAAQTALVTAVTNSVVEGVTKQQQIDFLEQLKQFARQEADLAKAREENTRLNQVITDLQGRVAQLNGIITTMSQGAPMVFNPYNNGAGQYPMQAQVPTYDQRYAATASVPLMPVQPVPPASDSPSA